MAIYTRRVWGWMFFDWASQPYLTLLLTFIFGPYFAEIVAADLVANGASPAATGARAQALWGWGLTAAGLAVAVLAPILGAVADRSGRRKVWIAGFSALYIAGAAALWWAVPEAPPVGLVLVAFGIGFIGMEFATIFSNALLPGLGARPELGRISGAGWAFGYVGGVVALILMLAAFADNAEGRTLLGAAPALGLDGATREGTRFVGPFTALWFALFMIPFFLWVRDDPLPAGRAPVGLGETLRDLGRTLRALPRHRSRFAFLLASLFYRDGLNGMFTFGGIYALGVLGWEVAQIGVFGILAAITGAVFAWLGGFADDRFGPKPVIVACIAALLLAACAVVAITETSVFGIAVTPGSALPTVAFYVAGCLIGAAGGALQSASRTMMVRQADPDRMTEGFGLYALSGKATTWLAPLLIAIVTAATDSQRLGIAPLILLFLLGLVLLIWVKPDGDRTSR
jgi:UMF1 family MFS transporter